MASGKIGGRVHLSMADPKLTPHPARILREYIGLTQGEFAKAIGLSQAYITQVESRRWTYGARAAETIVDLFRPEMVEAGVSFEGLCRGVEP